jgi:hypothetical protein
MKKMFAALALAIALPAAAFAQAAPAPAPAPAPEKKMECCCDKGMKMDCCEKHGKAGQDEHAGHDMSEQHQKPQH